MIIILSPAKTLDETSKPPKVKATEPVLIEESYELVELLKKKNAKEIGKLMGISEKLATLNHRRFKEFGEATRPAIYTFMGDVYQGFDVSTLPESAIPDMQKRLRLLSGLYGVLRPLDKMSPYRLEMGTPLKNPRGKDLYAFWGDLISKELKSAANKAKTDTLINLASQEYAGAVDRKKLGLTEIIVDFKERRGNKLQVISFNAKKARGRMARWIIEQGVQKPRDLAAFNLDSYRHEAGLSDPNRIVFVR